MGWRDAILDTLDQVFGKTRDAWANGWNACRAKMLEDEG